MVIKNDKFIEMILDDSYITWLEKFLEKYKYEEVDDLYFVRNWSRQLGTENKKMISYLKRLFLEINNYYIRNNDVKKNRDLFYLKYKDKYFKIRFTGECYECSMISKKDFINSSKFNKLLVKNHGNSDNMVVVDYDKLKRCYIVLEEVSVEETSLDLIIKKIMNNPDAFYMEVYNCLTPEERVFIVSNLINKDCSTCKFNGCIYYNTENYSSYNGDDCRAWQNEMLIGKSKVLRINDVEKMK